MRTRDVITGRIGAIQSLMTRIGMLSIPEDLLDGIDDIISFIYLLLVKLKENCSHMGCCLGVKRCCEEHLVYSVVTNGPKKIIQLISDRFIVSAEYSWNAVTNSLRDTIGVSKITLYLIGDKFSFCKSNFPFNLLPEVL